MLALWQNRLVSWIIGALALMTVSLNPNQKAVVQWTPPSDAEWAQVRLRSIDLEPQIITPVLKVIGNETPAFRPRSGHWAYEVRVCKKDTDGSDLCSIWVKSDESGSPEPWVIFWKPPQVTGIIIEDEGAN